MRLSPSPLSSHWTSTSRKPAVIIALPVLSVSLWERWPYGLLSINRTPSWHGHVTNVDEHIHEIMLPTVRHIDKLYWWLLTTTISPHNLDSDDFTEILISNSANPNNNSTSNNNPHACTRQNVAWRCGKSKNEKSRMKIWDIVVINGRYTSLLYNSDEPKWLNADRTVSY